MTRFKTLAFWIFIVLSLGIGLYAYFNFKNNKKPKLEAITVLPDNCLFYLNTNDFFELNKKINSQSLIADKLKKVGEINSFLNKIQAFDSLFNSDEDIKEVIKNNLIHFAFYKEKQSWVVAFNLKQLGRQNNVAEHLSEILNATKTKADIYSFTLKGLPLYFSLFDGVTTISNRQELIFQTLDKQNPKLVNNKSFIQSKSTLTENGLLSMYVNHSLYSKSEANTFLNLSYAIKNGYSAGAIDIQPSQLKINGFLMPEDEEIISFFNDQKPQSTKEIAPNLPVQTSFFKAFGFSSYPNLRTSYPLSNVHIKYWIKANERGLYNVEDDFNSNLINHLIEFETPLPSKKFICVEVNDTLKARENLKYMSDSLIKKDSQVIYKINDSLEKPLQLFVHLSNVITNYALIYNSHIYFSNAYEHLQELIKGLKNENLLTNNESFVAYKNQHFPDEFNYLIYNSPKLIIEDIPSFFNPKNSLPENIFENFKHFSFSASSHVNGFKFRLHIMHESENRSKEQNVLWTLNLDTTSIMTAQGFVNHITGENELIIQDDNNELYLINAKGTILWKKKLEEKIVSDIHRVDIYKKNKYQLLFNTKTHLHLIDRNGNYVEQYPVKLPAEATSPLNIFDYENDKDYRLFIACKNNSIYNYSIHGTQQEKFTTVKTENEVNLPIQYIKVGASDYLVALDKEGKIYTFSRKGVGRIGLRNRTNINCSAFYADPGNSTNSTYLIYVDDKNGLINKISFEDKKEIVKLSEEIENASVIFAFVDDNRSMDLIITKDKSFMAYNFSGNLIIKKTLASSLSLTSFYSDESHSVFYSLSSDKNKLIVFDQLNSNAKIYKAKALPLISNLFNDNKKYMIVTNGRQLNCVPLN